MKTSFSFTKHGVAAVAGLGLFLQSTVNGAVPGTDEFGVGLSEVEFGSIVPLVTESGFVSVSTDGLGMMASSGIIQVNKPAGATVRKAYFMSASTGFTGYRVPNGGVTLNGTGINWDISTTSSISSWNHWADVTAIVKPVVDAAPAGLVDLTVTEGSSANIDGEALAVIFDDPNVTTPSTVILLFGAQAVGGDTFQVSLADPIDTSKPGFILDMCLGISYGYQPTSQYSIVDVNSQRLSTSAGGQDDGAGSNGALITVGGIGDVNTNPPDPYATGNAGVRYDDELYNLIPFVTDGDTKITVVTRNPSTDDNIFFAAFVLSGGAVINEGIVLGPSYAENLVGSDHTVTATVQDDLGDPVVGRTVDFEILSGPHAGLTASGVTDADGKVTWTYTGTDEGVDEIVASMINSKGNYQESNVALKKWLPSEREPPQVSCLPTTKVSNLARYYRELLATSDHYTCSDLEIFVGDTATPAFVAGPFECGDVVRISKGSTASSVPGSYGVAARIKVVGNAVVWAEDPDGLISDLVVCP